MKIIAKLFNDPTLLGELSANASTFNIAGQFSSVYTGLTFRLIKILKTSDQLKDEFGDYIFTFQEKTDRQYNVLTLAIHGGSSSKNGLYQSIGTNSIRLENKSLVSFLRILEKEKEVELVIEEKIKTILNHNWFLKPLSAQRNSFSHTADKFYSNNPKYAYPGQNNNDLITYLLYSWAFGPDYNYYSLEPYTVHGGFYGFGGGDFGGGGAGSTYELPDPRNYVDIPYFEPQPVQVGFDNNGQPISYQAAQSTVPDTTNYNLQTGNQETQYSGISSKLTDDFGVTQVSAEQIRDQSLTGTSTDDTQPLDFPLESSNGSSLKFGGGDAGSTYELNSQSSLKPVDLNMGNRPLELPLELDSEPFKAEPFPVEKIDEALQTVETPETHLEVESGIKDVDYRQESTETHEPVAEPDNTGYESNSGGTEY